MTLRVPDLCDRTDVDALARAQVLKHVFVDDPRVTEAREEWERVRCALADARARERALLAKCAALADECRGHARKMTMTLDLSREDSTTIDALKTELERAWAMVDESHESELESKRAVSELKTEIERLTRGEDRFEDGTTDEIAINGNNLVGEVSVYRPSARKAQSREISSLMSVKESLTAERDELLEQTVKLREELDKLSERTRHAECAKLELDIELQDARDASHASAIEVEREKRAKERLEREIHQIEERSEQREGEIRENELRMAKTDEIIVKAEKNARLQERRAEAAKKELNVFANKSDKLRRELDEARVSNKNAEDANRAKTHEIRALNDEVKKRERERETISKHSIQLESKLRTAEQSRLNADEARDVLKREVQLLEQRLEDQKRALENEQRRRDNLMRERDVLLKMTTQAQNATSRQQDLLRIHEAQRQTLANEIKSYKIERAKQEEDIKRLDQQRNQALTEIAASTRRQEVLENEVHDRESQICDLQQQLQDAENRIKHAEKAYDVLRTERNYQSKCLVDAQSQIVEIKRDLKAKNVVLEGLREEARMKDGIIVSERFEHRKLDKEHEALRKQNDRLNVKVDEMQDELKHTNDESKTLRASIVSLQESRDAHRKQLDVMKRDRDVLNTQLVQRNQECALLYEKVKVQQKILNQGQAEYRERIHEIKTLKLRLASHTHELVSLRDAATSIDTLKQEVQSLDRELLHERTKVKALSEELESPMNVHRWRQLKGSDPTMYELIQKVQVLQRRLIAKTEEVTSKEILIAEKGKVLDELRVVLSRQPGPRAFEDLRETHAQIKEKARQIKGLQSELKMFIAHKDAYTYELGMLHEELALLRRKKSGVLPARSVVGS